MNTKPIDDGVEQKHGMTHDRVRKIISYIECGRFLWHVGGEGHGVIWIQPVFIVNGKEQHGRKWLISEHAVISEVVQTAFKALLTAAEHELRESFFYHGRPVFGPHFDVNELHRISDGKHLEVRE